MYKLIKAASIAYADATGNDPISFAKRLMHKLSYTPNLTPEQEAKMMKNLEKDFNQFEKDEKITTQDKDSYSVGNISKFKNTLEDLTSFLTMENIPRIVEPKDVPVVTGFSLAVKDFIGDLDKAKKETSTSSAGRLNIRYDIKSNNFKDAYNLLKKLPSETKDGKPFRSWIQDNVFPFIEREVKIKGKTEKVMDYFETFKAQQNGQTTIKSNFIDPIRNDIRKEMNQQRSKNEDNLQADKIKNFQPRRAAVVEAIRKLASKLMELV